MKVMDPHGRTVSVHRRWLPWRRRRRDVDASAAADVAVGAVDDPIGLLLTLASLVLLVPFVLGLVLLVGEIFLLVLLLPVAVLLRILFQRPWTVEATSRGHVLWSEEVQGWTASGVRVLEIAAVYERGDELSADRRTTA